MPAVLIHGVPDTIRVWDALQEHLSRKDVIPLPLPGFDGPLPQGFTATKEEYVRWIIMQLETIGQPVDLVGHDWGCILTMRVASLRPDLVRSWAAGSGPLSETYEWHPLAKIWQSPEGERWMRDLNPADLASFMAKSGLPLVQAKETAERIDDTMKHSILRLYRSAVEVGKEWQPDLTKASSPGLVFWGERDSSCPVVFAHKLGQDAGARRVLVLDAAHWVIIERNAEVALALEEHWASAAV